MFDVRFPSESPHKIPHPFLTSGAVAAARVSDLESYVSLVDLYPPRILPVIDLDPALFDFVVLSRFGVCRIHVLVWGFSFGWQRVCFKELFLEASGVVSWASEEGGSCEPPNTKHQSLSASRPRPCFSRATDSVLRCFRDPDSRNHCMSWSIPMHPTCSRRFLGCARFPGVGSSCSW